MSSQAKRIQFLLVAAIVILLVFLPFMTSSRMVLDYVIRLAAFTVFATSLNFLVGYGGMVSFGHAMFFGAGAYAFGLLIQKAGVSVPVAIMGTLVFCSLLAIVIGAICVQLKEIYFAFLTLAFQMLFYSVILTWTSLTGGDQGLMGGIRREPFLGINLGDYLHLYWFSCFVAVASLLLMWYVLSSGFGYTLRMTRDNPHRAKFLGINVWKIRLYAFILAGAIAGASGIIMALFVSGAYPEFAYWTMSGEGIFMIMMGGINNFFGPLVGAGLLLLFNDVIGRVTEYHGAVLGVVILVFALGFRRGVTDFVLQLFNRQQIKGESS